MTTAVDTSVLLDIFLPDPKFLDRSLKAVKEGYRLGALVICEPVYAELSSQFEARELLDEILERNQIAVEAVTRQAAFNAGRIFGSYRRRGGKRDRIITDFLIGSHAATNADRLLSRDRGFFRRYFENLIIIDPSDA